MPPTECAVHKSSNYRVLIMMGNSNINIETSEKYWFEQPSTADLQMSDAELGPICISVLSIAFN